MTTNTDRVNFLSFSQLEQQSQYLARQVASILAEQITANGHASLAVSGGSTPKRLFEILSNTAIQWQKVTILLVDDRWLDPSHSDSNQQLVERHLLQHLAADANFIALYQENSSAFAAQASINQTVAALQLPLDIVLLGMGNDGHTASLFPCSSQLLEGLSTSATYLATQPSTAPHCRISLSANAISGAKQLFLQLKGSDKKQTLERALSGNNQMKMPIRRFLTRKLQVLWCP
ncbi:MAG: hypothetical protein OFPII_33950 [Osedax symbiont Rs1]|nr:MAG: hypothetical protein OFPII_33950 [Osedax symbiont Rs1]